MVKFLVKMKEMSLMLMLEMIRIKPKLERYLEKPLEEELVREYLVLLPLYCWAWCHSLTDIGESMR